MAEEVLDLTTPGKFWAHAENHGETIFHIAVPKPDYTKERLSNNPTIDPADQLIAPFSVPSTKVDAQGMAIFDLASSGRAKEMMDKLADRYAKGGARLEKVLSVIIAKAKDGNRVPGNQVADVREMKLNAVPTITLTGKKTYLTVQNFKGGQKEFEVELSVTGPIKEVQVENNLELDMEGGGQKGKAAIKLPVKAGEKIIVKITAPFKQREEKKQVMTERQYISYGRTMAWTAWGEQSRGWVAARNGQSPERFMPVEHKREVWDGGIITVRAAGTGGNASVVSSVTLTAEAWAAAWLAGPPPPPFVHNCC